MAAHRQPGTRASLKAYDVMQSGQRSSSSIVVRLLQIRNRNRSVSQPLLSLESTTSVASLCPYVNSAVL